MRAEFCSLEEFFALRDEEKIDLPEVEAALDKLCFKKLNGALSRFVLIRKIMLRRWLAELGKITGEPPRAQITSEQITPYMQESGIICFCKRDIRRADKLFMLLAHESAHFILMRDKNYGLIKKLDGQYGALAKKDRNMRSPIELCANIITLLILERSKSVERSREKRDKIERCEKTLKKQLTNV